MSELPDINQLILKIHSTVLEPDTWPAVVGDIAMLLGADSAMLFSVPDVGSEPFWNVLRNLDPEMVKAYAASFVAHDEWLIGAAKQGREATGVVSVGEQLVSRDTFLHSLYYNEFLAGFGMDRFANVCLRGPSAAGRRPETGISFYREPGSEAFDKPAVELLGLLAPHLVLAIRNLWHARALSLRTQAYASTLDDVNAQVYALDARGRLVYANLAARDDLTECRWLTVERHHLKCSRNVQEHMAADRALSLLLKGFASTVLVADSAGKQAVLMTAPLAASAEFPVPDHAVGILWLIPLRPECSSVDILSKLFLLTPAEERLLRRLVIGEDVKSAANRLRITPNTARAQLKSIFSKTGRRSQAELLALVQRMSVIHSRQNGCGSWPAP